MPAPKSGKPSLEGIKKADHIDVIGFKKNLAATYSRGVYKTTTIGKTVFDGRVRNGNGSGHSFMATKEWESGRASFWEASRFRQIC